MSTRIERKRIVSSHEFHAVNQFRFRYFLNECIYSEEIQKCLTLKLKWNNF